MNYCLFLGHRYGYKALPLFLKKKADVKRVVIEQEFEHEAEKYDKKIIELCESHGVQYLSLIHILPWNAHGAGQGKPV